MRADYVLRALRVPAGEHEVIFKVESRSFNTSRPIMFASSLLLILLVIGMLGLELRAAMKGERALPAEAE